MQRSLLALLAVACVEEHRLPGDAGEPLVPATDWPHEVEESFRPMHAYPLSRAPLLDPWSLEMRVVRPVDDERVVWFTLDVCHSATADPSCDAVYLPDANLIVTPGFDEEPDDGVEVFYVDRILRGADPGWTSERDAW